MANNNDVNIRVGLKDDASKGFGSLSKNVKQFAADFKSSTPRVEGMTASLLRFSTGVAVGNLATLAARKGLQELTGAFNEAIDASNRMTSAMMGLSSVAGAFGENQKEARDAAKSLSKDGLMSVTDAARGLKNLLASGFGLQEAINLMNGFKDASAFNRQASLGFGEAIVGATEGIKNQNSILVDNVGITKNLSVILKEQGLSIQDLQNVQSDASVRQKLYNGLLREASVFAGDSARAAGTLKGAQDTLATSIFNVQVAIGQALTPAMTILVNSFNDLVNSILSGDGANNALTNFAKIAIWAVGILQTMGIMIKTVVAPAFYVLVAAIKSTASALGVATKILKGDFKGAWEDAKKLPKSFADNAKTALDKTITNFKSFIPGVEKIALGMGVQLDKINREGIDKFSDPVRDAIEEMAAQIDEAAQKLAEDIAVEMREFGQSMEKMVSDFKNNLKDLVLAHRDKAIQIQKDLKKEADSYEESLKERKEAFDKSMADIEKRHDEKTKTIQKQIAKEQQSISDEMDKVNDKYAESLNQFKLAAKDRLNHLQVQIDKEEAKGNGANKTKIFQLKDMLAREKVALEEQMAFREKQAEDEKIKVQEDHKEKLDELQQELDDEVQAVKEAKDEKIAEYDKELETLKKRYDERRIELETSLKAELAIQEKYKGDFDRLRNEQIADDITKLYTRLEEEKRILERDHQDRLNDLRRRAGEEAQARAGQAVSGGGSNPSNNTGAIKAPAGGFKHGGWYWNPTINQAQRYWNGSFLPPGVTDPPKMAEGGIVNKPTVAMIGEAGPEVVLPLNKPDRMRQILQETGNNGGGQTINIDMPVTVISSEIDIDIIAERLAFKLSKGGLI